MSKREVEELTDFLISKGFPTDETIEKCHDLENLLYSIPSVRKVIVHVFDKLGFYRIRVDLSCPLVRNGEKLQIFIELTAQLLNNR